MNPEQAPGELQQKPGPQDGDSRTPDSPHTADIKARDFEREPWFAKLPPDLQRAIRAKSRARAPRGYEERLRRYFENVD